MTKRIVLLAITVGLAVAGLVRADDNVREVQTKLSDEGFYSGEIDGAYSTDLSAALSRYQIRNGLPISGQLDVETSKALGAKPAVGPSTATGEQTSSETWRRLRKRERRASTTARRSETAATEAQETSSPTGDETQTTEVKPRSARATTETRETVSSSGSETESTMEVQPRSARAATTRRETVSTSGSETESSTGVQPRSAPAVTTRRERLSASGSETETTTEVQARSAPVATERTETVSKAPTTARTSSQTMEAVSAPQAAGSADEFSSDRLRDYVAAYVLAGLDKNVGAETEFFADRVEYYDQGTMDRDRIREDLKRYDQRWPERHFWIAGKINVEPQSDSRVRVTFPLGFKLRNANRQSSGKVDKTLVLERAGDDLQIVAVNEKESKK